jgi:hypothetical protein
VSEERTKNTRKLAGPCGQIRSTRNAPPSAGGKAWGISRLSGNSCRSCAPPPHIGQQHQFTAISIIITTAAAAVVGEVDPLAEVEFAVDKFAKIQQKFSNRGESDEKFYFYNTL